MGNFRIPGPICSVSRDPWIDQGTLVLAKSPLPGPTVAPTVGPPASAGPGDEDLGFLFRSCPNPQRGLTEEHYLEAATALTVEVAAIQAVAEVETSGNAFDDYGRPRILFERHYFHRLTHGKFDARHKLISQSKGGGYGKFSIQYAKLEEAWRLDPDAALRSASWGRFQIMGNNFKAAGFVSASAMVLAHTRAEHEHLMAFVHFVSNNKGMHAALRKHDWAAFASAYNGKGYKENNYDTKMAQAYARVKAAAPHAPRAQQ